MTEVMREPALAFVDQLRAARLDALRDAEAFNGIIHVVERLGSYVLGEHLDLGSYAKCISKLVENSQTNQWESGSAFGRSLRTPFGTLYDLVRLARNDALHQGAFARHLTKHAIELAIVLEDSLENPF